MGHSVLLAPKETKRLLAVVRAAEKARVELAALVANPKRTDKFSWPVDNIADGECLQSAYTALSAALEGIEE